MFDSNALEGMCALQACEGLLSSNAAVATSQGCLQLLVVVVPHDVEIIIVFIFIFPVVEVTTTTDVGRILTISSVH